MVHLMGIVAIFQRELCGSFHIICAEFLHILWGGHGLYYGENILVIGEWQCMENTGLHLEMCKDDGIPK